MTTDKRLKRYPDGSVDAREFLDQLIGESVEPLIAVFLPRRQREHDVEALGRWIGTICDELLPWLGQRYRLHQEPSHRALLGAGTGAPIAVATAFWRPGVFGALAAQSFYLKGLFGKIGIGTFSMTPELQDTILTRVRDGDRQELEIYLERSVQETRDPSSGLDAAADFDRLRTALDAAGYRYRTNVVPGRPGYGSWRAQYRVILEMFFPRAAPRIGRSSSPPRFVLFSWVSGARLRSRRAHRVGERGDAGARQHPEA